MREVYNSTFVYLKNFVLLYFWIADSGFRIPAFRVALVIARSLRRRRTDLLYLGESTLDVGEQTVGETTVIDLNNNIAEHHLKTSHTIDWDSATCVTYSTDYYQRIKLESWFTYLEQTAPNRCQPLPSPYKRLLNRKQ